MENLIICPRYIVVVSKKSLLSLSVGCHLKNYVHPSARYNFNDECCKEFSFSPLIESQRWTIHYDLLRLPFASCWRIIHQTLFVSNQQPRSKGAHYVCTHTRSCPPDFSQLTCVLKCWVQELSNRIWHSYIGMSYIIGKLLIGTFRCPC